MQRPLAITLLAALALLIALSNLTGGILLLAGRVTFERVFGQVPNVGDMQPGFEQTMKVIILLFGAFGLAVAFGLWSMRNWARAATRVLCVLGLLGALIQMIQAFTVKDPVSFLFSAAVGGLYYWVYFYLGKADVKALFNPTSSAVAPPSPPPNA
jgi:hypothetical protein